MDAQSMALEQHQGCGSREISNKQTNNDYNQNTLNFKCIDQTELSQDMYVSDAANTHIPKARHSDIPCEISYNNENFNSLFDDDKYKNWNEVIDNNLKEDTQFVINNNLSDELLFSNSNSMRNYYYGNSHHHQQIKRLYHTL
jgi:hypothetical protein